MTDNTTIESKRDLVVPRPDSEVKLGRIWWSADNAVEAAAMREKYLAAGAVDVRLVPERDRPIVDVHIMLDRARAKEILGLEPGPEEWAADLSGDASAVYSAVVEMAERHGLRFDADGVRDTVEQDCRLLRIELGDADVVQVCDEVLAAQSPDQVRERNCV